MLLRRRPGALVAAALGRRSTRGASISRISRNYRMSRARSAAGPEGAVHLPCTYPHLFSCDLTLDRGIAKVAKKLDIDYAEAIVPTNKMRTDM